jgi:hypothetical protein
MIGGRKVEESVRSEIILKKILKILFNFLYLAYISPVKTLGPPVITPV